MGVSDHIAAEALRGAGDTLDPRPAQNRFGALAAAHPVGDIDGDVLDWLRAAWKMRIRRAGLAKPPSLSRSNVMSTPFSLAVDTVVFAGIEAGEGIPVVFLHDGVCDSRMWESQIAAVAAAGHYAVAYDRRGHGATVAPEERFSHLEDLEAVLAALGIHAAVFVGSGRGGGLALEFALSAPGRVAGLVLVGASVPGAPRPVFPPEVMRIVHAMEAVEESGDIDAIGAVEAHAWLDGPLSPSGRVKGPARELFIAMNGANRRRGKPGREEPGARIYDAVGEIGTPTLLVVGGLDFPHIVVRHEDLSEEMENAFAAVIEDAAHLPGLERPDLFNPLLLEFLAALSGGADQASADD